jgi:hypothetical protein
MDASAGSIFPVTFAHRSMRSMQIATNRHASDGVNLMSSGFAIDDLDRPYSIVDSADIHASRPNCKFAPSLTYHNNAVAINKYVEAELRTVFAAPYKCAIPSARMGHHRGQLIAERRRRVSFIHGGGGQGVRKSPV